MRFIFLLSFFLLGLDARASDWRLSTQLEGTQLWRHTTQTEARLARNLFSTKRSRPLTHYHSKEFQKELQAQKKKTLEWFGVRDLVIQIYQVEQVGGDIIVSFRGSYQDHEGSRTFYEERHIYGPQKTIQLLLTAPALSTLNGPMVSSAFSFGAQ